MLELQGYRRVSLKPNMRFGDSLWSSWSLQPNIQHAQQYWLVGWLVGLSSISSPALIQDFSNYKMIVAKIEARIRRSLAKFLTVAQVLGDMSSDADGRGWSLLYRALVSSRAAGTGQRTLLASRAAGAYSAITRATCILISITPGSRDS